MCEICGGPHLTVKCPQFEGSSAQCYTNPFVQSQPYFSQGYSWNYYDNQPYYDDPYQQPQYNEGQYYDQYSGSNYDGGDAAAWGRLEELFVQLVAQKANTQKILAEQDNIMRNQQSALLDLKRTVDDMARRLEEEEQVQKVQPEQPTTGYTYDADGNYLGYMLSTGELIPTFPELGKELPYEDWLDEEITSVTETKMDAEVPPPVPQVPIINYWSDSDDEKDEEEWAAYQRSLVKKEVTEEEVELEDSIGFMFGVGDEIEDAETRSSGEDEFLELELDGLPIYEEVGVLDPDGDIAYFDALLEGEPTEVSNPTPDEETKYRDHSVKMVVEEEHHSWPVVLVINETSKSTKPWERAKKRKGKDRNRKRIEVWCKMGKKKKTLPFTHDQSSHYMSRIRFLPGKYKFWWSDSFKNFKIFYYSTIKCLTVFENRVELNGLDWVQIKEKPPD